MLAIYELSRTPRRGCTQYKLFKCLHWKIKLNKSKVYSLIIYVSEWMSGGTRCEFDIGQYLK